MAKSKPKAVYDNPFALNFDPMKFMFAGRRANAEFFGNLMKYNVETISFLKKRFEEDIRLAEQMATCDEVNEAMGNYIDFLRQAQIDYSEEMAKLFDMNAKAASEAASNAERDARAITEEYAAATAA